ncbi:transketolase [Pedosphaera parvula]|uniref:Transketolase n=1 Tax=Pedosphaera parvula (strain Ellin514) TaxID=320771 RepID=B9XJW4_PEDPL|nr:transketolase [Pedosphaera parvula]EEF59787.1 Transketolase domain protein [Pedosphaera parvula Ellin514]
MNTQIEEQLSGIANQLRIDSIESTTAAGSGHPSTCCSAADIVAALFFGHMRYDPKNPKYANNDRFILSKGHAAPLLYAAWAEAGLFPREHLLTLRRLDSDLEGHPTPRLSFVDVATGSLGQGLSVGVGMALCARLDQLDYRTYVLMGDGECAEGSVWEAASLAGINKLNNLVAIVDVNRLGQSQPTAFQWDLEVYRKRFEAFGWRTEVIDGHDMEEILEVLGAAGVGDQPLAIIAKTIKGQGVSFMADKEGWHGKALSKDEAAKAIAELQPKAKSGLAEPIPAPTQLPMPKNEAPAGYPATNYKLGEMVATREAFGAALLRIGEVDERVVALDGDTKNSTYSEKFYKKFPARFIECFIAEQNMVGVATGFSTRGKVPFASTFACFFSRAYDQIRMAAISMANVKLVGSHVGVSIGEDGTSQMALEDIAMMRAIEGSVVLYPSDAVCAEKLMEQMASHKGVAFLRTSRPKTPIIYNNDEQFPIGGAKVRKQAAGDKVTVVGAGVTLFEALKAADILAKEGVGITVIDAYSVKPLGKDVIREAAKKTNNVVLTVEDHYPEGGLGDAVAGELSVDGVRVHKLAIRELPHSGKPEELLAKYGIDAAGIVKMVKSIL